MSTSGATQIGIGTPAGANLGDAVANPSTIEIAALKVVYNGLRWDRERTPNVFHNAGVLAAGSTAVWTPTAGKKFRLMGFMLQITGDATLAAAGRNLTRFLDGAASFSTAFSPWIPAAALNNGSVIWSTGWVTMGNGYLSTTANNVLNVDLAAALVTGQVIVYVAGTEE